MITLLDGGMGQELLARSKNPPTEMWSARILLDEPELVTQVHGDYIHAGAHAITINAYAATPERLEKYGHLDLFSSLQAAAIACAHEARDKVQANVNILGSMPPLYSSYNPDLNNDYDVALGLYTQIADAQTDGVDVLLAETLGSCLEVRAALTAMQGRAKPRWISMSITDQTNQATLRSGEPLSDALAIIQDIGADAVLLNCSMPEAVSAAIEQLAAAKLPFGAYANGFTEIKKLNMGDIVADRFARREDLGPSEYADSAEKWISKGATIIGGCCEVGPSHIADLSRRITALSGTRP